MTIKIKNNLNQIDKNIEFYNKNGYLKIKVFEDKDIRNFQTLIKSKVDKVIKKKKWSLKSYHNHVNKKNNSKLTKTSKRFIKVNKKIIDQIKNNKKISNLLKFKWSHKNFVIPDQNYLLGKSNTTNFKRINKNEVPFRIVVPYKKKYSVSAAPPPHVDLNAGKIIKSNKRNKTPICFTLWTPLIGFSKKYTLQLAPGSHRVRHPINKIEKNSKYISPVFEKRYYQKFKFKRFDMKKGEAILFDVNLIHGGTENFGRHSRVNLEFRLYNQKKIALSF
tara:strand:+ start:1590 stop:2417 length:828 start_codon:yes stop_codon:yes gene_type:complete